MAACLPAGLIIGVAAVTGGGWIWEMRGRHAPLYAPPRPCEDRPALPEASTRRHHSTAWWPSSESSRPGLGPRTSISRMFP